MNDWTFGRKVGLGFAITVMLALLIAAIGVMALRSVVTSKDRVISENAQNLIDSEKLRSSAERRVAAARGFLLSKEERFLEASRLATSEFNSTFERLLTRAADDDERGLLDQLRRVERDYNSTLEKVVSLRRGDSPVESVARIFEDELSPKREALSERMTALVARQERHLVDARQLATDASNGAIAQLLVVAGAALLFACLVAVFLTRSLSTQLGSAVQHVHSSSAELQAAANQQATGAKEQATAMSEIATTISQLLASSRQIAESAQRVAQIATDTASAGRAGDQTVVRTQDLVGGIKRQVDLIVAQMLDLGRKSQQIGGVLEIINELAEQTNILAINATIEAAGAGETGRRFAVVADEVRKLADRVSGSTKEIRQLIEEIRSAVNTTVMATESGSKAADAGNRQFGEVATAFARIADLVGTTTDAAREIELSTKQQATAVEQVKVAIANVAQATKETEASSSQTLQTASQLTHLSQELNQLIQPRAAS